MALKELEARYATKRPKNYKLADRGRLYLLVRPNGAVRADIDGPRESAGFHFSIEHRTAPSSSVEDGVDAEDQRRWQGRVMAGRINSRR